MRRALFVLAVAGLAAVAGYAGWWVRQWRSEQEEKRLRTIHTLTGNVTRRSFPSEVLGADRDVWVYLPPGYESESDRRYPVLYMQDGQNVFDGATAFIAGEEWQADETAESLIGDGRIEPLIIVAVDNAGEHRTDEYTPVPDHGQGGGADVYRRFLVEELKPWVDATWRTRPGPADTGIAGSSFGGLVSLWIALGRPDVFDRVAALSPSVWWDDRFILKFVGALPGKTDARIWIDSGTREKPGALEDARRLRDALEAEGWEEGVDLRYVEAVGAPHNERAWARRLPEVLEFLYPPPAGPRSDASPEGGGE